MTMKEQITQRALASIRSDVLGPLRDIQEYHRLVGPLAQFEIVVDANIILSDLIWLAKRTNPTATTELMECARAGTIVIYIARSVFDEINEHITTIATKRKIPEETLRKEWKEYRKFVKVRTPPKRHVDQFINGQDPDDAPTLALQKMLRADGILTKDSDIVAMGGLVIELDFTEKARDYSRDVAIAATIRFSGSFGVAISWEIIKFIFSILDKAVETFKKLPPEVQIIFGVVLVGVVVNPQSRKKVLDTIANSKNTIIALFPGAMEYLEIISAEYEKHNVLPPVPQFKTAKNRAIDHRESK